MIYTSSAAAAMVTNTATCVDLSSLPDEALDRAIREVPDYRPIQFVKRDDYRKILATRVQVMEEIANRKLRREVNTTRFYDKSFIDSLRYQAPYHPTTKWPNIIPSSGSGASQHEEDTKEELKLVDKIFGFFDKFSIKFAGGKDVAIKSSEGTTGEIPKVVLDSRTGPTRASEEISSVATESK